MDEDEELKQEDDMSQNDDGGEIIENNELEESGAIQNMDFRSAKACKKDVYKFSVNHENPLQIDRALSFQDVKSRWFTNIELSKGCLSD